MRIHVNRFLFDTLHYSTVYDSTFYMTYHGDMSAYHGGWGDPRFEVYI